MWGERRLTELNDEDDRREDCVNAADSVEECRALVLCPLVAAERVLA